MSPPRAAAIRLRLRNTVLAQRSNVVSGRKRLQLNAHRPGGHGTSRKPWQKMWVSTNKVLIGSVGGLKKTHCRNPNFDCEETKLLISLWGDPQVQRTLITTHKKHPVIAKLAEKMREYGYNRSTEEINTRIKNLKCFYNRIKKDLETGVINEPSWKHYQAMDEILTRPVFGGAHAVARYAPTVLPVPTTSTPSGRNTRPLRHSEGSSGPELSEVDADQIEVKLELVSDDEKELRAEELLKNAEQVELKEPNLLIPKDEPMEEEDDDPNDPDFEDDGGSETDDESSGMDEADESERSTRARRRTKRVHKPKKATPSKNDGPSTGVGCGVAAATASTAPPVPGTIKIINYTGGANLSISSVTNAISSAAQSGSATITTLAGRTGSAATTSTTANKISLVPTNFLLKPQTSNVGFKQPIQLYTKPTVSIATTKPTPGLQPIVSVSAAGATVTTSGTPGTPMKLLLVNTLPKDGSAPKQQLITPSAKQIYTTSTGVSLQGTSHVSGLPKISIQPKQLLTGTGATTLGAKFLHSSVSRPSHLGGPPKLGGFKALLNQLVGLQRENLGITKSRLVTEKERFSNEKSVARALLDALGELDALITEVNADFKDSEEPTIKLTGECPSDEPRSTGPVVGQEESERQPEDDDDNMKTEVISDSDEG